MKNVAHTILYFNTFFHFNISACGADYSKYGEQCYHVGSEVSSHEDAHKYCVSKNGFLAMWGGGSSDFTPVSQALDGLSNSRSVWTGGKMKTDAYYWYPTSKNCFNLMNNFSSSSNDIAFLMKVKQRVIKIRTQLPNIFKDNF